MCQRENLSLDRNPREYTWRSIAGAKDSHSFLTWVISPMSNALGFDMMRLKTPRIFRNTIEIVEEGVTQNERKCNQTVGDPRVRFLVPAQFTNPTYGDCDPASAIDLCKGPIADGVIGSVCARTSQYRKVVNTHHFALEHQKSCSLYELPIRYGGTKSYTEYNWLAYSEGTIAPLKSSNVYSHQQ